MILTIILFVVFICVVIIFICKTYHWLIEYAADIARDEADKEKSFLGRIEHIRYDTQILTSSFDYISKEHYLHLPYPTITMDRTVLTDNKHLDYLIRNSAYKLGEEMLNRGLIEIKHTDFNDFESKIHDLFTKRVTLTVRAYKACGI